MARFRRRTVIVHKRFQLFMLGSALCYVAFLVAVLAALLFVPLMLELGAADPASNDALIAATSALYLHERFWLASILTLVVIALHSIWTSHRIAGPLYRLRVTLEKVRQGRLPARFNARRSDFFQAEVRAASDMIECLRGNIEELQQSSHDLRRTINQVQCRLRDGDPDVAALVENLDRQGEHVEQKLGFFKLEP